MRRVVSLGAGLIAAAFVVASVALAQLGRMPAEVGGGFPMHERVLVVRRACNAIGGTWEGTAEAPGCSLGNLPDGTHGVARFGFVDRGLRSVRIVAPEPNLGAALRHATSLRARIEADLGRPGTLDATPGPSNCASTVFDGPRDESCLSQDPSRSAAIEWRWSDGLLRLRVDARGADYPVPECSVEWRSTGAR